MWTLALALGLAISVWGCAPGGQTVVDGWPVGATRSCPMGDARCEALLPTAIRGFDQRSPGHAAIVRATLHDEGPVFDSAGNQILMTRSGACCAVALFELTDGTVRAIGVGYVGVSQVPEAVDRGP